MLYLLKIKERLRVVHFFCFRIQDSISRFSPAGQTPIAPWMKSLTWRKAMILVSKSVKAPTGRHHQF